MFRFVRNPDPRKKPPYGSRIDPTHPLAQGLVGCWLLNEGGGPYAFNLCTGINASIYGNAWCPEGVHCSGINHYITNDDPLIDQNTGSFFMIFRKTGTADDYGCLFNVENDSNDSAHEMILWFNPTYTVKFQVNIDQSDGDYWDYGSYSDFTIGRKYTLGACWHNGSNIRGLIDGKVSGSPAGGGSWTASDWTSNEKLFLGKTGGVDYSAKVEIHAFFVYSRYIGTDNLA